MHEEHAIRPFVGSVRDNVMGPKVDVVGHLKEAVCCHSRSWRIRLARRETGLTETHRLQVTILPATIGKSSKAGKDTRYKTYIV
ncbi:MAG: hypothetical protein ACJAY7_000721 [Pseudohongiellaceae bacterium]|jgi:hypothetical protein